MKELLERSKSISCIQQRYLSDPNNLPRTIIGNVYVDLIRNQSAEVSKFQSDGPVIDVFRRTFLSNFSEIGVTYHGNRYISVEHAYQDMKFFPKGLRDVSDEHIDRINRVLETRREKITAEDLPRLFTNPDLSAGTSKVVAGQLRILGYVREDWDHVKLPIMLDLLIQKRPEWCFARFR